MKFMCAEMQDTSCIKSHRSWAELLLQPGLCVLPRAMPRHNSTVSAILERFPLTLRQAE